MKKQNRKAKTNKKKNKETSKAKATKQPLHKRIQKSQESRNNQQIQNVFSIVVAGQAGQGVKSTACLIAKILSASGLHVFCSHDYQSLITGGHNFSYVTFSKTKIESNKKQIDILLCLDNSVDMHLHELTDDALIIIEESTLNSLNNNVKHKLKRYNVVALPFSVISREANITKREFNVCYVGYLFDFLGTYTKKQKEIWLNFIKQTIMQHYRNQADVDAFIAGYGFGWQSFVEFNNAAIKFLNDWMKKAKPKQVMMVEGNEAIALAAVNAGLAAFYAYPMTPATSTLSFLQKKRSEWSIIVVQPENELAVINMALGSSYAGHKTMVATSGGGFALMTEAISMAGMAELPVVILLSQRTGPSTGVPTYTAQSDVLFAIHAGHGSFAKFVVSPANNEQAMHYTQVAFEVASHFRVPAIILVDKHLSTSYASMQIDINSIKQNAQDKHNKFWFNIEQSKNKKQLLKKTRQGMYAYYSLAQHTVPMAFPGSSLTVKANSYEHDEYGITTENAATVANMQERRQYKFKALQKLVQHIDSVNVVDFKARKKANAIRVVLLTYGSTTPAVIDAAKQLSSQFNIRIVQPIVLWPIASSKIVKAIQSFNPDIIIVVECNATSVLKQLLSNPVANAIELLKYDARPFYADELANMLLQLINANAGLIKAKQKKASKK